MEMMTGVTVEGSTGWRKIEITLDESDLARLSEELGISKEQWNEVTLVQRNQFLSLETALMITVQKAQWGVVTGAEAKDEITKTKARRDALLRTLRSG